MWQIIYTIVNKDIFIASPLDVFKRFFELIKYSDFYRAIFFSFARIFCGFIFALIIGVSFAALSSFNKSIYTFFSPLVTIIKSVPAASIIMLVFIWLKSDFIPTFIAFLLVMPIFYINIYKGIFQTDKKLIEMSEIFRFSKFKKIKYIYIPSIMPYFVTAFSTGLGLAWKSGITAEILCSPIYSIGLNIKDAKIYLETTDLFLWTILIIIINLIFEKLSIKIIQMIFPYISDKIKKENSFETD